MPTEHIHFVTGRLAEHALRQVVEPLSDSVGFAYSVDVLPITVAALMTPGWIAARIDAPEVTTRVVLPGYCEGDLHPVESATGTAVERGPRDLRQLPAYFGRGPTPTGYGDHDIEIVAEINHCPELSRADLLSTARQLSHDGADVIDLGCNPNSTWSGVGDAVRMLVEEGLRVSIDSWNPQEVASAVKAGAELVLSVSATNREAALDWGCEVVVVPDEPGTLEGLDETIEVLTEGGIPLRIDPILEPIGFGFAASLERYLCVRKRYPDSPMLMGIGNLTELTDVDSAGVNTLLLGFCQELDIRSVLTTQVIHWARTSVRECDLARRLVHHAVRQRVLPKHVEPRLVTLRDTDIQDRSPEELDRLSQDIKDRNYRIFATGDEIHSGRPGTSFA